MRFVGNRKIAESTPRFLPTLVQLRAVRALDPCQRKLAFGTTTSLLPEMFILTLKIGPLSFP